MLRVAGVSIVVGIVLGCCYAGVMEHSSSDAATWKRPEDSGGRASLPPGFAVAITSFGSGVAVTWWVRQRIGAPRLVAAAATGLSGIIAVGLSVAVVLTWLNEFPAAGWTILGLGSLFLLVGMSVGMGAPHRY